MRQILIITLFVLLSTKSFADKKFEKDLKKISKDDGFVDNLGKIYTVDTISDKKKYNSNCVYSWKSR